MTIIMPGQEDTEKYGGQIINPSAPRNDLLHIEGQDREVISERHDLKATGESIQRMLAGGTPNWVKWPEEYKAMAKESFAAHREDSERGAAGYKWVDQKILTDEKARKVNGMSTRDFVERKLRANGIQCAVFDNGFTGHGGVPTVGLFCVPPTNTDRLRPIGFMDVPMMWEWSILNLDQYGIPSGYKSRGWRDLAILLVEKDIITEAQCHRIFGAPPANALSARYYRSLWEKRHGKPYLDEEDREGFGN